MRYYYLFSILAFASILSCKQRDKDLALFTKLEASETNIDFVNVLKETPALNIFNYDYLYNGSGVAAGDFNNDGLVDLFFVGNTEPNKLYLNTGGFKFSEVAEKVGVTGHAGWRTGVSVVDINADGWLDIYLCYAGKSGEPNRNNELYINKGRRDSLLFEEQAEFYGLAAEGTYSTQSYFFDFDLDGDLDMFLVNHGVDYQTSFLKSAVSRNSRHPEFGNRLYRNDNSKFEDISEEAGIEGGWLNFGLSASISDFNIDGYPDLYVANDFDEKDFLYLNQKDGTFKDVLENSMGHISKFTMGTDAGDINHDMLPDLITLDMLPEKLYRKKMLKGPDDFDRYNFYVNRGYYKQQMRNMLHVNRGNTPEGIPIFSEVGQLAGISATDWSWAPLLADFNNDGMKDLFISNGYWRDLTNNDFQKYDFQKALEKAQLSGENNEVKAELMFNWINKIPSISLSNYFYINEGSFQFSNQTAQAGLDEARVSTGAIYADLDNDGDLDLVTNNTNEQAGIYRNNATSLLKNNFIKIRLVGEGGNSGGIGCKIYIYDSINQYTEYYTSRGYLSSLGGSIHVGMGASKEIDSLKVVWPGGKESIIKQVKRQSVLSIYERDSKEEVRTKSVWPNLQLANTFDVTGLISLDYRHVEKSTSGFKNERLLLADLSRQGPKIATADVNGDGFEDFFVGGASGQSGQLFLGTKDGLFVKSSSQPWESDKKSEDVGVAFFDADGDKDLDLVVASGGADAVDRDVSYADRLYQNDGNGRFVRAQKALPDSYSSSSCVSVFDFDYDGDVDLFVGGWVKPQHFPMVSNSVLLRNDSKNGEIKFTDVTSSISQEIAQCGLVTDASWADVDHDGLADLIVVGHWMPITIFKNTKQGFVNITKQLQLEQTAGLWNRIKAFDIDSDNDMDFIIGNQGTNGELKASINEPVTLVYDDFDNNGQLDPLVSIYEDGKLYPVATRDDLLSQVPSFKKKFVRYEDYADKTVQDIIGEDRFNKIHKKYLHVLTSSVLMNNGNGEFTLQPLPVETQFSPVQAILIDNFNSDNVEDILLAGNFYPYRVEFGPFDASYGVLLQGKNKGDYQFTSFRALIKGDVRDVVRIGNLMLVTRNNDSLQVIKIE